MDPRVTEEPGLEWVPRLRRGNRVWLTKESEYADVEYPYEPPEPGHVCGKIGLRRSTPGFAGGFQVWFVGLEGQGIDSSQLMQPVEGHLLDAPEPLPEPEIRQLQRHAERLESRLKRLEDALYGFVDF